MVIVVHLYYIDVPNTPSSAYSVHYCGNLHNMLQSLLQSLKIPQPSPRYTTHLASNEVPLDDRNSYRPRHDHRACRELHYISSLRMLYLSYQYYIWVPISE